MFHHKLKGSFLNNRKSVLRDIRLDTHRKAGTVFPIPCLLDLLFPLCKVDFLLFKINYSFHPKGPALYFYASIFFLFQFGSWGGEQRGYRSYVTSVIKLGANRGRFWTLQSFFFSSVKYVFTSNSYQKSCEQEHFNLCSRLIWETCLLCMHITLQQTDDWLTDRVQHQDAWPRQTHLTLLITAKHPMPLDAPAFLTVPPVKPGKYTRDAM